MNQIPDEKQIEEMLENTSLQIGNRLDRRLYNAPWTMRTVARRQLACATFLMVLILGLFAVATPPVRAFAQQFLGFFQTSSQTAFSSPPIAQTPVSTVITSIETVTALPTNDPSQCGDTVSAVSSDYLCQLKAAEVNLGFDIRVFSKSAAEEVLKTDLNFMSLAADPSTQSVRLVFSTMKGVNLWLAEGIGDFPEARIPWEIVPQTAVQTTQVGEYSAEYLVGDFVQWAGSQEFTWESNVANTQRLRWKQGGQWFEIRSMGGGREMSDQFEQADLIFLGENLVSMSQGIELLAGNTSPGFDQRTGFHVREPSVLPKGFQLCSAGYDAGYDGPTVFLSYCDGLGNSLVVDQILVDKASPYDFTERWGEPITVTPVQIGSVTGYHALRGDGIQVVVWEEDGVRTQIVFQWDPYADAGTRIDQVGMLSIANGMK
jgi:hypothetical protein